MNGNLFRYHQLLSEKDRIVEIGEQECFSEELPFPSVHFDFCGSPPDLNMLFLNVLSAVLHEGNFFVSSLRCSASRNYLISFYSFEEAPRDCKFEKNELQQTLIMFSETICLNFKNCCSKLKQNGWKCKTFSETKIILRLIRKSQVLWAVTNWQVIPFLMYLTL